MAKFSLIVWSEPTAGQEDEYNDWYSNKHLDDVCNSEGFTGAKRYVFAAEAATPRKYLSIYDVDAETAADVMKQLGANPEAMNVSPAINLESVIISVVSRI